MLVHVFSCKDVNCCDVNFECKSVDVKNMEDFSCFRERVRSKY